MKSSLRPLYALSLLTSGIFLVPTHAAVVSDPAIPAAVPDTGATAPLVTLALSPDGSLVYSIDKNGELLARDLKTSKTLFHGTLPPGVSKMRVLKGGSLLVGFTDGGVRLYSKPVTGKPLVSPHLYTVEPPAQAADAKTETSIQLDDFVLSPDGSQLAIQTIERAVTRSITSRPVTTTRVRVWKLSDDKTPLELTTVPAEKGASKIAWSDEKTLVVARPDISIQRFDVTTAKVASEWKPPADAVPKIDAAKEEAEFERRTNMLPPAMQERVRRAHERQKATPPDPNAALDFGTTQGVSNDGRLVLSATRNGLQLWNSTDNSNHILEKSERLGNGEETVFSSDNRMVAVRSGGGFWLWNADGSQIGWARVPFAEYSDIVFTPDSSRVVLSLDSGDVRAWKTTAPLAKTADTVLPGFFQSWTTLSAGSGALFAATERGVAVIDAKGAPRWFDNVPLKSPAELPDFAKTQNRQNVVALTAAPDGKSWAESVSFEPYSSTLSNKGIPRGELRVRDAATGAVLWSQSDTNPYSTVTLLRFLPDGTLLTGKHGGGGISATPQDMSFVGLQARDGKTGADKDLAIAWGNENGLREPGSVDILEASQNGKRLVVSSGSGGAGIQTIDMDAKKVISYFGANTEVPLGPWSVSNDGHFLAGPIRGGGGIALWDISAPRPNNYFTPDIKLTLPPADRLQALSWSATGSLAAGLKDGRVLTWTPDFQTDKAPTWETTPGLPITSLTWSSDSKTLSSGDQRGDLKTRDAQTGTLKSTLRLLPPTGETTPLTYIRWTPDGKITPMPK